ncbi:hypothetical protein SVIOM342S_03170 [Streptomyces violaceorubidus]
MGGPRLSFGDAAYWAQHDAGDDVFYADAAVADRAASRAVVVVALNGGPEAAAVAGLTAAHSRAGALLIVCGDPQRINSVLGAAGVRVRSDGCGARRYDPGASVRSPCTEAGLGVPGHAGDVVP